MTFNNIEMYVIEINDRAEDSFVGPSFFSSSFLDKYNMFDGVTFASDII